MGTFFWILIVAHVALCVLLILLVLVQNDKMGGLAGLGGMTAQSALSTAGAATLIQKLTRYVALILFAVLLSLSVMATRQDSGFGASALQKEVLTGQGAVLNDNFVLPIEGGDAPPAGE
ncbi:MAG: preprotein translocase subunit SecG [Fibromonadaceae bacterium]|jgi:preprotein translocase subunit SecG|nr:preprotein translocase subunit SecG [Fibromonadaceae bacterium]